MTANLEAKSGMSIMIMMYRSKIYSARNNIVHQFESIVTWKTLVTLHPWNFEYLLAKNHMIVLFTSDECDECKHATSVFVHLNGCV